MARLRYNPPSSLLPSRAVAIRVNKRMEGCALPRKRRLDEIVVAAVDAVSSISTSTSSRDGFSVCCGLHRMQRIHMKSRGRRGGGGGRRQRRGGSGEDYAFRRRIHHDPRDATSLYIPTRTCTRTDALESLLLCLCHFCVIWKQNCQANRNPAKNSDPRRAKPGQKRCGAGGGATISGRKRWPEARAHATTILNIHRGVSANIHHRPAQVGPPQSEYAYL
jgi:hypothetical protein